GDGLSRALGKRIDATRLCQCAAAGDWTSVPVALRLGCHGPGPSDGGGALRRAQSGVRALRTGRGPALRAHLKGRNDGLVDAAPLFSRATGRFADPLDEEPDAEKLAALRAAEGIERPLGLEAFLDRLAGLMGRGPRSR